MISTAFAISCILVLYSIRKHRANVWKLKEQIILTIHSRRYKCTLAFLKAIFKIKYFLYTENFHSLYMQTLIFSESKEFWMDFYLIILTVPFPSWCLQAVGSLRANWFPRSFDAVNDTVVHAGKQNMRSGAGADSAGSCTPWILRGWGPWPRPRISYKSTKYVKLLTNISHYIMGIIFRFLRDFCNEIKRFQHV